jgi:hypothetical protein
MDGQQYIVDPSTVSNIDNGLAERKNVLYGMITCVAIVILVGVYITVTATGQAKAVNQIGVNHRLQARNGDTSTTSYAYMHARGRDTPSDHDRRLRMLYGNRAGSLASTISGTSSTGHYYDQDHPLYKGGGSSTSLISGISESGSIAYL